MFADQSEGASQREASYMDRLVDIILSLLAYSSAELPSAPLREAIEALFRAFAYNLTQTGTQQSALSSSCHSNLANMQVPAVYIEMCVQSLVLAYPQLKTCCRKCVAVRRRDWKTSGQASCS